MYAICLIFFLFEFLGQILLLNALNKYELILLEFCIYLCSTYLCQKFAFK